MTNVRAHALTRARSVTCIAVTAVVTLTATGCSTPQPARSLALQGAAVADKAQTELDNFVDRADRAYKRREAILRELAEGEIRDVSEGDFRAWINDQADVSSDKSKVALVKRIAERSQKAREESEAVLAAKSKQLSDAAGPGIKTSTTNLGSAKKAFLVLSQELSTAEWLKFSQSYVQQLRNDLKALDKPTESEAKPKE